MADNEDSIVTVAHGVAHPGGAPTAGHSTHYI
jgi:hypothetical protein